MGLSMVHGIVESYGGKITVDSEFRKRNYFFDLFAGNQKNVMSLAHMNKMSCLSGTERILFVDDELPIAKIEQPDFGTVGISGYRFEPGVWRHWNCLNKSQTILI